MGTNEINNLTVLKFFSIATAIQKNLCLACYTNNDPELAISIVPFYLSYC